MSQEDYARVIRGLYQCQKRPVLVSGEAYTSAKRAMRVHVLPHASKNIWHRVDCSWARMYIDIYI